MELPYSAQMRAEARAGQETHGSIGAFLRDTSASFKLVAMYVADVLSVELNTRLALVEDIGAETRAASGRALRGVHVTDRAGSCVIVLVSLADRISADDCALFFQTAIDRWDHIIIARTVSSTLSEDLAPIARRRKIDWPIIHVPSIELFVTTLLCNEADRREEVEAQRGADRREEVEAQRGADRREEVETDDIEDAGFVARACARITEYARRNNGVLPTQNGPRRCRVGRTLQYLRSSRDILSADDRALVESIPGWSWDVHGDKFHARLSEFIAEVAVRPNGLLSHRVRRWIAYCARKRRRGELSQERIDILSATPGWVWPAP